MTWTYNLHFIADTETEKYNFQIISAMSSDKRYVLSVGEVR